MGLWQSLAEILTSENKITLEYISSLSTDESFF